MSNIVKRLRDWQHVYPEDQDKTEGHLYEEAANRIEELEAEVEGALAIIATERAEVMELRAENQRLREAAGRIEELEAKLDWVITERDETFALMLDRAQTAEAKLAQAVGALDEAIYLLDPDEEDIAKETGLHRIVTTYRELKGETND
jgi:tetrahydromethanopterin S-methyltransferase subunit G